MNDAEVTASLGELGRLWETLGGRVVGHVVQKRPSLHPAGVLGEGKLEELAEWTGGTGRIPTGPKRSVSKARARWDEENGDEEEVAAEDEEEVEAEGPDDEERRKKSRRADAVVVDHELSPSQLRNLERATSSEVMDRTGVIVEIFHRHARSREARLQVEIARLTYLAPRLRETGGGDRQRGGIGGKGAGESAVELDRRKIRDRIASLREELAGIEGEGETRRARRAERFRVALVGYTNAGKSSLMRALTGSAVYVADKLFATLDTTVRALVPETIPRILVTDTVGFIKKLPHDLVASFRSTLDEALSATLLLQVVDASDPTFRAQLEVTSEVLAEIGAGERARRLLFNKVDRLLPGEREALTGEFPDAWFTSAVVSEEIAALRARIVDFFAEGMEEAEVFLGWSQTARIGDIRSRLTVLSEAWEEDGVRYRVRGTAADLGAIRQRIEAGA